MAKKCVDDKELALLTVTGGVLLTFILLNWGGDGWVRAVTEFPVFFAVLLFKALLSVSVFSLMLYNMRTGAGSPDVLNGVNYSDVQVVNAVRTFFACLCAFAETALMAAHGTMPTSDAALLAACVAVGIFFWSIVFDFLFSLVRALARASAARAT